MPDHSRILRPRADHVVAPLEETPLQAVDAADTSSSPRSLWSEAWHNLRRNPVFIVSAILLAFVLFVAFFPQVFSDQDPRYGNLNQTNLDPSGDHLFGTTKQGYDIFARTVFGARTSVTVGFLAMIGSTLIGGIIGAVAGYFGGWFDEIVSRVVDIFFAVPMILGAIVIGSAQQGLTVWTVVLILSLFGWTNVARIMRGSVISVKQQDFVTASTALGASRGSVLLKHIVPNAIAPVIVTATVNMGMFIVAEATLSFLGVGLPPSAVSWGGDINDAQNALRTQPTQLLYPSVALAITVLSFIMLGDAVRDALDPKARKR